MYLYHRMPPVIRGITIYPLNQLRDAYPDLYDTNSAKYAGREHLTKESIPILGNCLWNDVIFLTAVHPEKFRVAYQSSGQVRGRPFRAFEFPVEVFDHSRLAVLRTIRMDEPVVYQPFDPARVAELGVVPPETIQYWKAELRKGNLRPLLYMHIPHFLYRGTLDTTRARSVEA